MTKLVIASSEELRGLVDGVISERLTELREPPGRLHAGWLTNDEVGRFLGVSRSTLQRLRSNGSLRYSKVGRRLLYRRSDLDALLERNTTVSFT